MSSERVRLAFNGESDDTFGEYGTTRDNYDNCASGEPIIWKVQHGEAGLLVWGQYAGRSWPINVPGCWMIGVQQLDEDEPIPDWPMRYTTAGNGYSPVLVIDAPAGTEVTLFSPERSDDD